MVSGDEQGASPCRQALNLSPSASDTMKVGTETAEPDESPAWSRSRNHSHIHTATTTGVTLQPTVQGTRCCTHARTRYGRRHSQVLLSMQFVQLGHWGEPPWLVGPHNGLLSTISTAEAPAFSAWRTFCTKVQSPRSSMMMGSAGHEGSRVMGPQPVAFTPGVPYTTVPVMAPVHAQDA